jgi:drug/metabolite transporter (DMT)-like permease
LYFCYNIISPFFTAVLAWLVLGEPMSRRHLIGSFFSLVGVVLIARPATLAILPGLSFLVPAEVAPTHVAIAPNPLPTIIANATQAVCGFLLSYLTHHL